MTKTELRLDTAFRFIATNARGHETVFDLTEAGGGLDSGPTPMDVLLESMSACASVDIVDVLRKRRKTIESFAVSVEGIRAEDHPRVYTNVKMHFRIESPDISPMDLSHAVDLSFRKYCSVTIMIRRSGCEVYWDATIIDPVTRHEQLITQEIETVEEVVEEYP